MFDLQYMSIEDNQKKIKKKEKRAGYKKERYIKWNKSLGYKG